MGDFRHIDPNSSIAKFLRDARAEECDVSNESRNLIFSVFALLFVAGCGGGGGNGGSNPPVATGELVTITSDNATTVAGVVAQQVLEDNLFGALTTAGLPVANAGSGAAIAMSSLAAAPLPTNMLAAQSTLQDCANGGTVDVTVDISNPLTISPGGIGTSPIRLRADTVLPQPDSPTRHTVSFWCTSKLTPSTAWATSSAT